MKNNPVTILFVFVLLVVTNGCSTIKIDRGRVEDSWTMKIVNAYSNKTEMPFREISIKPNSFFSLNGLGLKDNTPYTSNQVCNPAGYKGLYTYGIEIQNSDNNRKYYGRIAFFQALSSASAKAAGQSGLNS